MRSLAEQQEAVSHRMQEQSLRIEAEAERHQRQLQPMEGLSRRPSAGGRGAAPALAQAAGAARRTAGPVIDLNAGDNVLHPKFGLGTVVSTAGEDDTAEAHIDFGSEGVKRLLLRYAPVEKV